MRQGDGDRGKGEGLEGVAVCLVQQGKHTCRSHATRLPNRVTVINTQNTEISWKWEFLIGTLTEWI